MQSECAQCTKKTGCGAVSWCGGKARVICYRRTFLRPIFAMAGQPAGSLGGQMWSILLPYIKGVMR